MKEKIKIILLIIIFVICLIGINKLLNFENQKISINETNIITNNLTEENTAKSYENDNNELYIDEVVKEVTEENFNEEVLNSDKTVLIDFYADWCGPCKQLSPRVEEVAKEKKNIKFVKIDVDKNYELSMKYQTMSIPTLVVIKNGEEINRAVGLISKSEIINLIGE